MSNPAPQWPVCEVHTQHTDMDCEYCQKQLDGQQAVLNAMHEGVQDMNRKLAQMTGVPYIETATAVAALKSDVIVAMIFTDPKARMAYELNFANALREQMDQVHKQMVRQQITGGGPVMPSPDQAKIVQSIQKRK